MTSETNLVRAIMLEASRLGARLFRNNVGQGWVGKSFKATAPMTVTLAPGDVVVRQARPLHAGLAEGSGDLIGWTEAGRFASVEVKTATGTMRPAQTAWISAVGRAGGVAGVCRSPEDLGVLLGREKNCG